jgi:monoamine oxidase
MGRLSKDSDEGSGAAVGQARLRALRAALPVDVIARLPKSTEPPKGRVLVVGGGFGGLASAYFLLGCGFEVVVYEAGKEVGGRVRTSYDFLPGRAIEFGAELIGWNHALWLGLGEVFGLDFSMLTEDAAFEEMGLVPPLELNGEVLSDSDAASVYSQMDEALETLVGPARFVRPYQPWSSLIAPTLDQLSLADWKTALKLPDLVDRAVETLFSNDNVVSTSRQSYLAVLGAVAGGGGRRYWSDTEVMRCAGGNASLAVSLARAINDHRWGEVRRGTPVNAIRVGDRKVTVRASDNQDEGDYVVLAVPPTVWKRIEMPKEFDSARYTMSGGPGVKFFSSLKERFWISERKAPTSMSDRFGETWEGTDNQIGKPTDPIELSVFAGGTSAETARSEADRPKWYSERIKRLYPGYPEQVTKTHFQSWPDEEWINWGYSCPEPGQVTTVARALSEPFADRLIFAGEHACPAFFGYMEGALESGLLAMGQIGAGYGLWKQDAVREALEGAAEVGWQS